MSRPGCSTAIRVRRHLADERADVASDGGSATVLSETAESIGGGQSRCHRITVSGWGDHQGCAPLSPRLGQRDPKHPIAAPQTRTDGTFQRVKLLS
jgi:uncharacterized protein YuzE